MQRKARYFPLEAKPLRMQPGLLRFGSDFGNGPDDALYFPVDADQARYLQAKADVLAHHPARFGWLEGPRERAALEHVGAWLEKRLGLERGVVSEEAGRCLPGAGFNLPGRYDALARSVAEDLVVLARDDSGNERAILVHVCFPTGWRPETILGRSFAEIHARVPEFGAVARAAPALVGAMIERGPYVRFVWAVSADARLDHHPDHGERDAWSAGTTPGYLRVERQVTVPFPEVQASLFLIRIYLYGFDELSVEQRRTLASALEQTSAAVLAYKGLAQALPHVLARLRD